MHTASLEFNMGKENSIVKSRSKKAFPKTSLSNPEEKVHKQMAVKKLQSKSKKEIHEFDDMGSLIFLNEITEEKKLKGVDERIKVLKNELKSLFDCTKLDKDNDLTIDTSKDFKSNRVLDVDEICKISSQGLGSNSMKSSECSEETNINVTEDVRPSSSSMPSKFSVWLDKTIDEMDSQIQKEKQADLEFGHDSILQLDPTKTSSPLTTEFKSDFSKILLLPQDQVEKLLYKSFVLQNSEIYLSSSEDSDSEHVKSDKSIKQRKCKRSRKQCYKAPKEKVTQGSTSRNQKFHKRGRKRRLISGNSLSNVEVIDLDSSSSINEVPKANSLELDLNNYDWNEPFDLDNTEFYLDVEIIDSEQKSDAKSSNQNLKKNTSEFSRNDQSVCYKENGRLQQKGVWECPVCFEQAKGQEVVATQCGHVFCKKCLENHISKLNKNCPTCRSDLKDKPFITLFNF